MNKQILIFLAVFFSLTFTIGYAINISGGDTITENFTIGATQTASLPVDWKADKNLTVRTLGTYSAAVTATEQFAGNGMSGTATNGIYNYGAGVHTTATDRCVGFLSSSSSTKSGNLYTVLTNSGASAITSFTISYKVEKYRTGTNAAGFSFQMYYSTDGVNWITAGTDFQTSFPADATTAGYASAPGDSILVNNQTLSVTVSAGNSIYLAWNYSVTSSTITTSAQALGIDDVSITANGTGGGNLATVTTDAITAITINTASSGGNITSDGGAAVTARGVCWNTSPAPTLANSFTVDGSGTAPYVSSLTGLTELTTYYVRAYATNSAGTAYGNELFFATLGAPPAAPVAIPATALTVNAFTANWNPSSGAISYRLDVSTGSGFSTFVSGYNNLSVTGTSQSVTGLSASSTYYYRVRAVNASGTSDNSNIITAVTIANDPFNGYYSSVAGLSGSALKSGLHTIIRTSHTTEFAYFSTTEQLRYTDEDSTNTNNIIEIYTGWSIPKTAYGVAVTDWNKEHVWSKSHGNFGETAPAGTDLHNLRPCDATVNSMKSNDDFDEATIPYTDASPYNGYSGVTGCYYNTDVWEPRDADKGDIARIIFYMDTRYEGTDTSFDLQIINTIPSSVSPTWLPYYAKLSTLLSWHYADPPDAWEMRRNNRIQERQGNRNPFIDHPEYVSSIWGGGAQAPTITTALITSITLTTASGGGEVTSGGTAEVTARGICWSSTGTPSTTDSHTINGTGTGIFTSSLTSLSAGTLYYVRAYATNSVGTAYGNEIMFTTLKPEPAAHVTAFSTGTPATLSIPLSWIDAGADGYLIKASSVSYANIVAPADGIPESDATLVKNVPQGTQASTFTGLSSNTTYFFKIYPYSNSGADINYKTDGTVPQASTTTLNSVVLSVEPASMTFSTAYGTFSAAQSCLISSAGLTLPVDVASVGPYEFSLTENGTYTTTLQVVANYNGIVWIKFHPLVTGTFTNPLTFSSGINQTTISTLGSSYDPNASVAVDLFISEYVEGSSNNKGLEIFNGTGVPVNLQNYRVANYYNGGTIANTLVLGNINLNNGDCYTIVNSLASTALQNLADLVSNSYALSFNGNDAVALEKTANGTDWVYVDILGRIGDNPGTAWTGDGGYTTLNSTLVRKPTITGGITVSPTGTGPTAFTTLTTEWNLFPVDTFTDFGIHTFQPSLPPTPPTNLTLTIVGADVILSWDNDPTVQSWNVYTSDQPYAGFTLYQNVAVNQCVLTGMVTANSKLFLRCSTLKP
jgi:endonuclease I